MLFAAWTDQPHRATHDLDLLNVGDASDAALMQVFGKIIRTPIEPQDPEFDDHALSISEIRAA